MTFFEAIGLLIGAALALLGLCALVIWLEKKCPSKRYDERQKEVRGKAYKWACFAGVVYFSALASLNTLLPTGVAMDMSFAICIGLVLQGMIVSIYCSLCGAYLPFRRSPKVNIILLYSIGVLDLIDGANAVRWLGITLEENYLEIVKFPDVRLGATGDDVLAWLDLILAVGFLFLATIQLICYKRQQAE